MDICRPFSTPFRMVYFWYLLIYVILRACTLSFTVASINDESKRPINVLRVVPSHSWNSDIERFMNDAMNDEVAIGNTDSVYLRNKNIFSFSNIYIVRLKYLYFHQFLGISQEMARADAILDKCRTGIANIPQSRTIAQLYIQN